MSSCRIILYNYNYAYFSNSVIEGHVECYFANTTKIRGVKIRLKCEEHNEWIGSREYYDEAEKRYETESTTFTGNKDVFIMEEQLYGSSGGEVEMQPGKIDLPFRFVLPPDCPSTYEGPHGYVKYKLKAVVDRPLNFDYENEYAIIVNSIVDMNQISSDLLQPIHLSDDTTVCCCCCAGGVVTMNVTLAKGVMSPGEKVALTVDIENTSNQNVRKLKINLNQIIRAEVDSPNTDNKEDVENLLSIVEHGVGSNGRHTYQLQLEIPPHVKVFNFERCSLFSNIYKLNIIGQLPNCYANIEVSTNIKLVN